MTLLLHELVSHQAAKDPRATAIVNGQIHVSYRELESVADAVALTLLDHGVGPGDLVAVLLDHSHTLVMGMLGVLKSGAGYLPLDPEYPVERLAYIIRDSGAQVLLTTQDMARLIPIEFNAKVVLLEEHKISAEPRRIEQPDVGSADTAYVIYTSGSTGSPKGVLVEHRNIVRLLQVTQPIFSFGPEDVWTSFHSCAFDFSVWEIWGALASGGRVVMVPRLVARTPRDFARLVAAENVTVLNQTPSAFQMLAPELRASVSTSEPRLRLVIFGGERLDITSLASWFTHFDDQQPALYNMYGITETTVHVTAHRILQRDLRGPAKSPIGPALSHLKVQVLDDSGQRVPVGGVGEIYVGGDGVARGYLNKPELTAQRFVPDPYNEGQRLYRSGDLVRVMSEENLEYVGRLDHQVKIRGYRIELGEIESVLCQHPKIAAAVVEGRPGPMGHVRLVAYLLSENGDAPTVADVHDHLSRIVPKYMLPAIYIPIDELPLTINGKIDRAALPDPGPVGEEGELSLSGPARFADPVETQLGVIWQEVLGREVKPEDNFFDLGGDSLLAVRVAIAAGECGLPLELVDLFEQDSLRSLAQAVSVRGPSEC